MSKRLTPKQAILAECRYCMNSTVFHGCSSEVCKLNDISMKHSKRIKAHCLNCIPEQSIYGVKVCDGKVLNPEPHICYLWEFRLGKNPKKVEAGQITMKNAGQERLKRFYFKSKPKSKGIIHPDLELAIK